MACFIVPATEAIITTAVAKVMEKKENDARSSEEETGEKIRFSQKLGWLNKLLWGGSALLAFEHVWHGEVVPFFPFLTAVQEGETAGMLQEMGTVGVGMAVLVTAVWGCMLAISSVLEKKEEKTDEKGGAKA